MIERSNSFQRLFLPNGPLPYESRLRESIKQISSQELKCDGMYWQDPFKKRIALKPSPSEFYHRCNFFLAEGKNNAKITYMKHRFLR